MTARSASLRDAPIAVAVAHKDPLVREGVVSVLRSTIDVDLGLAAAGDGRGRRAPDDARRCLGADVVVADYDTALDLLDAVAAAGSLHAPRPPRVMIVSHRDKESEIRHALNRGVLGYMLLDCALDEMVDGIRALHRGQRHLDRSAALRVVEGFDHQALTSREGDVLRLIAVGHVNKTIATELEISVGTVKAHVKAILSKFGAKTRTEAAAIALRRGMLGLGA